MFVQVLKNIFSILILAVFILASYFFLVLQGDTAKLPFASSEVAEEKSMVVVEKLSGELSKLETVTINATFFESAEFLGLVKNFREPLPELIGEKDNPFF